MSDLVLAAAVFSVFSWFLSSLLSRWGAQKASFRNKGLASLLAGFVPTLGLIAATVLWHLHARAQFEASGATEGFMSPAIIVLMAMPLIVLNLVANVFAALWAARK
jgi:hypothetical protein